MKQVLKDIQDGTFAKDFLLDMSEAGGQVHFKAMRESLLLSISQRKSELRSESFTVGAMRIS